MVACDHNVDGTSRQVRRPNRPGNGAQLDLCSGLHSHAVNWFLRRGPKGISSVLGFRKARDLRYLGGPHFYAVFGPAARARCVILRTYDRGRGSILRTLCIRARGLGSQGATARGTGPLRGALGRPGALRETPVISGTYRPYTSKSCANRRGARHPPPRLGASALVWPVGGAGQVTARNDTAFRVPGLRDPPGLV
jgi:hypothetical protein